MGTETDIPGRLGLGDELPGSNVKLGKHSPQKNAKNAKAEEEEADVPFACSFLRSLCSFAANS
jgi:hypothetical protein